MEVPKLLCKLKEAVLRWRLGRGVEVPKQIVYGFGDIFSKLKNLRLPLVPSRMQDHKPSVPISGDKESGLIRRWLHSLEEGEGRGFWLP